MLDSMISGFPIVNLSYFLPDRIFEFLAFTADLLDHHLEFRDFGQLISILFVLVFYPGVSCPPLSDLILQLSRFLSSLFCLLQHILKFTNSFPKHCLIGRKFINFLIFSTQKIIQTHCLLRYHPKLIFVLHHHLLIPLKLLDVHLRFSKLRPQSLQIAIPFIHCLPQFSNLILQPFSL